jgi:hypothetical protein
MDTKKAMALALENYSTWGQWVVECYETKELEKELKEFNSLEEWVEMKKIVTGVYSEIENTQF